MPIPVKNEVEAAIAPLQTAIVDIMRSAWADWLDSPYVGQWEHKRTRANFVWAQIAWRAREAFQEDPAVHIIDSNETLKFLVNDSVLFRLKKGDDKGLTANIATQQVLAYHDHDKDLFGLPEVHRVDIVYQLNLLETDINDVVVVARDEGQIIWTYSLLDSAEGVVVLPIPETEQPVDSPARRLVRMRASERDAESEPRR